MENNYNLPPEYKERLKKAEEYLKKLSGKQREKFLNLLKEIQTIQKSEISQKEKTAQLKLLLWTNQNIKNRLMIGGLLGMLCGAFIFGSGGVGIAALGGATGVSGLLLSAVGGTMVASLISNFESKK